MAHAARAAEHLAFDHFQAIDLALPPAHTPLSRDPGFSRGIVVAEPCGKLLEGAYGTPSGTFRPGIELRRLPQTHELREVLGKVDHLPRHTGQYPGGCVKVICGVS